MIRLLGILSVVLFWIIALALSPVVLLAGVVIFILSIVFAVSSLVYDLTTRYFERKKL